MIYYLLPSVAAFLFSVLFSRHLSDPRSRLYVLDHPNQRSLHSIPTPRNGGIAVLSGFVLGRIILWFMNYPPTPSEKFFWIGLILTVAVSFLDDRRPLSPGVRLFFQLSSAILLMVGGFALSELNIPGVGSVALGWFGLPFSILYIVWMMNLYNFMDGMDGFAGGMGSFGFGFIALLGWLSGELYFSATALIICAANLGFLTSNFPPSSIFMGDVGSVPMGFMAACFSLWGVREGIFDFWIAVLIFSPFIADATVTVIRRWLTGEKVWQAHRTHYYQRLVQMGWGHRKTVLIEYIFMFGAGSAAVFLRTLESELFKVIGLLSCCLALFILARMVDSMTLPPK